MPGLIDLIKHFWVILLFFVKNIILLHWASSIQWQNALSDKKSKIDVQKVLKDRLQGKYY